MLEALTSKVDALEDETRKFSHKNEHISGNIAGQTGEFLSFEMQKQIPEVMPDLPDSVG